MDHRVMTGGIVMTLAQLTYFIEIAKTKNFTEAASNLYISQSNISYAIHALEDELDALLFVRRPNKRIELTMYGETLYPYIAEGIRLIEEGKNRVSSMKKSAARQRKTGIFSQYCIFCRSGAYVIFQRG